MITGAVYEFNMQSTNTAKGDLVSYDASERQLVYYIDKKIILKEILKIAGITAAVIAVIIAVIFTIISIDKNNYSKQINEMRGNIINEIQ